MKQKFIAAMFFIATPAFAGICDNIAGAPVIASFDPFAVAIAAAPVSAAQVACLYSEGLGRPGSEAEINAWVQNAAAYQKSFDTIRREITTSPEAYNLVRTFYQQELGREAEPEGLNGWVGQLAVQGAGAVREAIRNSPEGTLYRYNLSRSAIPDYPVYTSYTEDLSSLLAILGLGSANYTAPTTVANNGIDCSSLPDSCQRVCQQTSDPGSCFGYCLTKVLPMLCH